MSCRLLVFVPKSGPTPKHTKRPPQRPQGLGLDRPITPDSPLAESVNEMHRLMTDLHVQRARLKQIRPEKP
jgi:hypothetical protein